MLPVAIRGTHRWRPWNFAPCSVAVGEPVLFEGLPSGGRGYKEATAEIELTKQGPIVRFAEPEIGISPGQACVVYDDAAGSRVLGGGFIRRCV